MASRSSKAEKPEPTKVRRRAIRFTPEPGTLAQIDLQETRHDDAFKPTEVALVFEEASKGCGIVIVDRDILNVGDRVRVKVGKLSPIRAEVRWRTPLDATVSKVGLLYLE